MIGYKLVRMPLYTSLLAEGHYTVHYTPGTIVSAVPGTVGLMIFRDQESASAFLTSYSLSYGARTGIITLEIEYTESSILPVDVISQYCDESALLCFYGLSLLESLPIARSLPMGTVCCTSVTVLKEVPLP